MYAEGTLRADQGLSHSMFSVLKDDSGMFASVTDRLYLFHQSVTGTVLTPGVFSLALDFRRLHLGFSPRQKGGKGKQCCF